MPKIKTTEQHKQDGTYRADRHSNRIGQQANWKYYNKSDTEPPKEIEDDAEAVKIWVFLISNMQQNTWAKVDKTILILFCEAWSTTRQLRGAKPSIKDKQGNPRRNPEYAALKQAREEVLKLSNILALSPVARTRINKSFDSIDSGEEDFIL